MAFVRRRASLSLAPSDGTCAALSALALRHSYSRCMPKKGQCKILGDDSEVTVLWHSQGASG